MCTNRNLPRCLAVLILWIAAPDCVSAGPRYAVWFGGGASFPVQPTELSERWDTGFLMCGGLETLFTARWRAGLEVGFASHHGSNLVVPVMLSGTYDLLDRGSTKPFVSVGVGICIFKTEGVTVAPAGGGDDYETPDDTAFGAQFGAGVSTRLAADLGLSIDVLYQVAATDAEATGFIPLRVRLIF
jgi:opacity protein-like surface antigen